MAKFLLEAAPPSSCGRCFEWTPFLLGSPVGLCGCLLGTTWDCNSCDGVRHVFFSWLLLSLSLSSVFRILALEFSRPLAAAFWGRFHDTSRQLLLSHSWPRKLSCTSSPSEVWGAGWSWCPSLLLPRAVLTFSGVSPASFLCLPNSGKAYKLFQGFHRSLLDFRLEVNKRASLSPPLSYWMEVHSPRQ